jgi:hypothetical protein
MSRKPVLECELCGIVVRELTPAEADEVAANPYNFIVTCRAHRGMA